MARKTTTLTDKEIKAAKAIDKSYKLFDGRGLYLEVTKKGKKWWRLKYRYRNKDKLISLGVYPSVSLADARMTREIMKAQIANGIDPAQLRAKEKQIVSSERIKNKYTFKVLAVEYFEYLMTLSSPISEGYQKKLIGRAKKHAYPIIGNITIDKIEKKDVLSIIDPLRKAQKYEIARRVLLIVKNILEYAIDRDLLKVNIASGIKPSSSIGMIETKHYPIITEPKQLKALLLSLDDYSGDYTTKQALRVMPHVALRPFNIRFAEWSEIDFINKIWSISANKMKMKEPFRIPLTEQVIQILKETKVFSGDGRYIFPSILKKGSPMSENTLNSALRRLGYTREEIVSHSFRGIFSTIAHSMNIEHGCSSLAIEKHLSHKDTNKIRDAYMHSDLLDERIVLTKWWSDYLDGLRNAEL